MNANLPTITYAGHEIAVASLPSQSIEALRAPWRDALSWQ